MKLKKQITTAMIYPAILGGFSFLIICLLLGFVVPSLEDIFAERKLNAFTKRSDRIKPYFPLLLVDLPPGCCRRDQLLGLADQIA